MEYKCLLPAAKHSCLIGTVHTLPRNSMFIASHRHTTALTNFSKKLNYDCPGLLWQQKTFRYSRTDSSVFRIALDKSVLDLAELTEQRDTDYFF